ncbi:MAG: hypothetical protein ACOCWC_01895 [Bacteroidota bacterium]
MQVFILAIVLIAIAIGGIAIKMFLLPGGSFTKKCGSYTDPKTGKQLPCTCNAENPTKCENKENTEITEK